MTWEEAAALGLALPGVELSTSYGTPALKVKGKMLARLWEDGATLVLKGIGFDQREMLIETAPESFFFTEHYRAYDCVLVRLAATSPEAIRGLLAQVWRQAAPKRLVKAHDSDLGSDLAP